MTNIATNLRIALSSTINQSHSFDLDALFLNFAFSDQVYFSHPDATTNTDPFLFTLPYFSNQTLTLTIEENLNGFAGQSFSIEVEERETGTDLVLNTYTIEIEILEDSSNTIDDITVRENQLGQVFDPADVNFGLANPISGYAITDGGDYVIINNQNMIELNPSFDPDDNDISGFTFTIQATDGTNTAYHTVTVAVQRVDDTAPGIVSNIVNAYTLGQVMITEDMINYTDEDPAQTPENITYFITGDLPSGVSFFNYDDDTKSTYTYNPDSFTHQDILDGLVGFEFTDLAQIEGLSLLVSDGFNVSKNSVTIDFRTVLEINDSDQSNTIDLSAETKSFNINSGDGHDIIKTGSGDDIIAGGLGNDVIDLSGGGDDTVIYQLGRDVDGNIYAKDAYERVLSFDRGNDTLVLKPNFQDDNLRNFNDYIDLFKGEDGVWGNRDDQMLVSFQIDFDGGDFFVTNLVFNFKHAGPNNYGLFSNPMLVVEFEEKIPLTEFAALVEKDGNLNVDPLSLTIIDLSVLPNIFGEGKIVFEDSYDVLAFTSGATINLNEKQDYTSDEVIYQATSNQTGVEWSLVSGGDLFNIDAQTGELRLNAPLNFVGFNLDVKPNTFFTVFLFVYTLVLTNRKFFKFIINKKYSS